MTDAPAKVGRPTDYTDELVAAICVRVACDESLVSICSEDGMPSLTTVYRWLQEKPAFRANYTRARNDQAETVADKAKAVRDKLERGELDHQTANAMLNFIKWETGKRNPKVYGDKTAIVGGDPEAGDKPIAVSIEGMTPEQLAVLAGVKVAGE